MRKIIFLTVLCFFVFMCSGVYAHPPSAIKAEYNAVTRILTIIITHPVSNAETHYISKVDVRLNGKEIIEHQISRQDNNGSQFAVYMVPDAKVGDTIAVEAYCSISGKLKKELKVSG